MDKLFDTKRKYIANDGEEYLNLSIPVIDNKKINGYSTIVLTQNENGRIDKVIWKSVAKNMDMIDTTMYANHIFNPFAVKDGDVIYIPNDNDSIYQQQAEPELPDGTKYSNNEEKEMTYAEKVEYLAKKGLGLK